MTFNEDEILNMFEGFNFLNPAFDDTRVDELVSYLFNKGYIFNYDFGATKLAILPRNKDYVIKNKLTSNVVFTGKVPWEEIVLYYLDCYILFGNIHNIDILR